MNKLLSRAQLEIARSGALADYGLLRELPRYSIVPSRNKYWHNRHRDPKYSIERGRKLWKVDLPDFDQMRLDDKLGPDEVRTKMKEKGIAKPNTWEERKIFQSCSSTTIDPYKPLSSDGISSSLVSSVKAPWRIGRGWVKTKQSVSAIRNYDSEDFSLKNFAASSTDIYIKAIEALAAKDEEGSFNYITERCFPLMTAGLKRNTLSWKYLGDVEPPECIQARVGDLGDKTNKYAQVTVRMFTKQILAIFDRHGRLIHGSPTDVKEVLEYIVFERYLPDEFGFWRIHDRIRPAEAEQPFTHRVSKTFVVTQPAAP